MGELSESQRCGSCKVEKLQVEFSPSYRGRTGTWCRSCFAAHARGVRLAAPNPPQDCRHCGNSYVPRFKKGAGRYCSSQCKSKSYNEAKSAEVRSAKAGRVCRGCGASVAHLRSNAAWCSRACSARRPAAPAIRRRSMLKTAYGITPELYEALLAEQRGACALCRSEDPKARHGRFAVDHDHLTGAVRALLCSACNTGIGQLGDDPDLLIAAAAYVRRHRDRARIADKA